MESNCDQVAGGKSAICPTVELISGKSGDKDATVCKFDINTRFRKWASERLWRMSADYGIWVLVACDP